MAILAIADDLTGAAEIGGIALRYGLSAEIVHTGVRATDKDVLIINSNTRSFGREEALQRVKTLFGTQTKNASFLEQWDWVYLKFDSALRGHIQQEISLYRTLFGQQRLIFCPVHLVLNRIIRNGIYWVDGRPIAETDFAHDPEFPIRKSGILEAIGATSWLLTTDVPTVGEGINPYVVAQVEDSEGLDRWAASTRQWGMFAGAAAFFDALLRKRVGRRQLERKTVAARQFPVLYICGSKHENSQRRLVALDADKVVYWQALGKESEIAAYICHQLEKQGNLVFAIAADVTAEAPVIRQSMAQVLAQVQQAGRLKELVIEGGATAGAVLEALKIDKLLPLWEYGQGVIRTQASNTELHITLKPGSYPWTDQLWEF